MMMINTLLLGFITLVVIVHTLPNSFSDTYQHHNNQNETSEFDDVQPYILNDEYFEEKLNTHRKALRQLPSKFIDGSTHYVKHGGASYRQRIRDGQCFVEYEGQLLTENSIVQIRRKFYRMEECLLERVFHACGPNLLLMLNVVCRVVEKNQPPPTTTPRPILDFRRPAIPYSRRLRPRRANKTPRVITESCCENLCTISELTRYCHR